MFPKSTRKPQYWCGFLIFIFRCSIFKDQYTFSNGFQSFQAVGRVGCFEVCKIVSSSSDDLLISSNFFFPTSDFLMFGNRKKTLGARFGDEVIEDERLIGSASDSICTQRGANESASPSLLHRIGSKNRCSISP